MLKRILLASCLALLSSVVFAANQAVLSWTAPTANTDGSAIAGAQLPLTYTILSGTCGSETVLQTGVTTTTFTATGFSDGQTICFKVFAVDALGSAGVTSSEVSKSFPKAVPNAPTGVSVQ